MIFTRQSLIEKAAKRIPADRLWVNPDCGLKTRGWPETREALTLMVEAAKELRGKGASYAASNPAETHEVKKLEAV